jgi:uncharacterized protein (DUF934 family)
MSYQTARECFQQNMQMVGEPMSDPQTFNINSGLDELAVCIQQDIAQIQQTLTAILNALHQQ